MSGEVALVPGRSCGKCNACCSHFFVPALDKPAGVLCQHWKKNTGCTIHASRPQACRDYFCLWRMNASLDDGWRPDLSGFILREVFDNMPPPYAIRIPAHFTNRRGLLFELHGPNASINTDRFIQTVASQIAQQVPVFLSVTRHGQMASILLNEVMSDAVASRQRSQLLGTLRDALKQLEQAVKPPRP